MIMSATSTAAKNMNSTCLVMEKSMATGPICTGSNWGR
jgi:hypothetical protein